MLADVQYFDLRISSAKRPNFLLETLYYGPDLTNPTPKPSQTNFNMCPDKPALIDVTGPRVEFQQVHTGVEPFCKRKVLLKGSGVSALYSVQQPCKKPKHVSENAPSAENTHLAA